MDDDVSRSLKTVAKGAGILFIGTMLSKAIMYVYRIIVARPDIGLGAEAYGELSLALGVFWVGATLSQIGIPKGVERYVSEYIGQDDEEGIKGMIHTGLKITIPWSIIVAATLFLTADLIATYAFHNSGIGPYVRIFALGLPFQALFKNGENIVNAFRAFQYSVYVDKLFRSLVTLGLTVLLIYMGYGLLGAVIAQLIAIISSGLLMLYYIQTRVFPIFRTDTSPRSEPWRLLSFSWPIMLSATIGLVVGWTDTFMLGFFDTTENVGIYNAALPTAQLLLVVGTVFSTSLFPNLAELYGKGKKTQALIITESTVKWIFSLAFPAVLLMILFAGPILHILFGNIYVQGAVALSILGAAYFIRVLMIYAGSFIQSEDRTIFLTVNSFIVAILNIVLNYILIQQYSTTGAAMATAFSLTIGSLLAATEAYYFFGVQPFRLKKLLPSFFAATIAAGTVYIITTYTFMVTPLWVLLPSLLLFLGLYGIIFLLLGGLEEEDVMILNTIEQKSNVDLTLIKKVVEKIAR